MLDDRSLASRCRFLRPAAPLAILGGAFVLGGAAHAAETLDFAPVAAVPLPGSHPVMNGQVSNGERFGRAVSGLGDVDGDGVPDLVVGSRSDGDGGTDAGAVYVILMNRDLSPREAIKIGAGSGGMPASEIAAGDFFGYGVAGLGDLDGDGVPDLAVTAPNAEPPGMPANANQGALFICFLRPDGSVREHVRIDSQDGLPLASGDSFGQGLANLGDLDGDGRVDLGVGAPGTDDGAMNAGAFFVVRVSASGSLLGWDRFSRSTDPQWLPLEAIDNFGGRGSAAVGDLDGDGTIEVAVGCYRDDDGGADRGAVWLLSLAARPKGGVSLARTAKISATAGGFGGPLADGDLFGMTVAPLGDLDGDGIADLAVGNNLMDQGFPNAGGLFLLGLDSLGAVRSQTLIGQGTGFPGLSLIPGERFGRALANLGDVRGDGSLVLAVGAGAGVDGGRLWLVAIGRPRSADLDGNGLVNGADLTAMLAAWGGAGPADLDWSGSVDGGDLAQLLAGWK
jgi:hypothetical protein